MQKVTKKDFYEALKKTGRDIRHGIMCNLICFDPDAACDCYEFNVHDEDVRKVEELMIEHKCDLENALKKFFNES